MAQYRATRNEPRVGVGDFTRDFFHNEIVEAGDGPGQVPAYICDYLVSHGILVDARIADGPAGSPLPASPTPPVPEPEPELEVDDGAE